MKRSKLILLKKRRFWNSLQSLKQQMLEQILKLPQQKELKQPLLKEVREVVLLERNN